MTARERRRLRLAFGRALERGYALRTQLLAFRGLADGPGVVTPAAASGRGASGEALYAACLNLLETNAHAGDALYPGEYGGADVAPLEVVFAKTGRGVAAAALDAYGEWFAVR